MSEEINMLELLIGIKEDVSVIKTKMSSFEEAQERDRETFINKSEELKKQHEEDIKEMKKEHEEEMRELKETLSSRISIIQNVQNNLVGEIETLKQAKDTEDARKWRTVMKYILTAFGGIVVAKLPVIVRVILSSFEGE